MLYACDAPSLLLEHRAVLASECSGSCPPCRDDLVNLYIEAMQSEAFTGVYNATAPNPVRMSELCSSLGSVLGRPSWLPVPDFALQVRSPQLFVGLTSMLYVAFDW